MLWLLPLPVLAVLQVLLDEPEEAVDLGDEEPLPLDLGVAQVSSTAVLVPPLLFWQVLVFPVFLH